VAAKNKNESQPANDLASDIGEALGLHPKAAQHRDDLLKEARELQAAGKIREARKKLRAAQEIQHRITALETEARLRSRDPQT
jgi:hypothetical protein